MSTHKGQHDPDEQRPKSEPIQEESRQKFREESRALRHDELRDEKSGPAPRSDNDTLSEHKGGADTPYDDVPRGDSEHDTFGSEESQTEVVGWSAARAGYDDRLVERLGQASRFSRGNKFEPDAKDRKEQEDKYKTLGSNKPVEKDKDKSSPGKSSQDDTQAALASKDNLRDSTNRSKAPRPGAVRPPGAPAVPGANPKTGPKKDAEPVGGKNPPANKGPATGQGADKGTQKPKAPPSKAGSPPGTPSKASVLGDRLVDKGKNWAPARSQRKDGSNAVGKNAAKTAGAEVIKGAALGAVQGAAGGLAGIGAGAAKGAAMGAGKGAKKAGMGAASDVGQNAWNKTKSKQSSEGSAPVSKPIAFLAMIGVAGAMFFGGAGEQQQAASGVLQARSASSNEICNPSSDLPILDGDDGEGGGGILVPGGMVLNIEQKNNAKTIIGVSKSVGFGKDGAIIGIMTAIAESTLRNLDYGDDVGPDSRGLFQQRHLGGWGTEAQIANPVYASQAFYLGVGQGNPGLNSYDWQSMDPWVAAQKVQRSAFSDGSNYKVHHDQAKNIVTQLWDESMVIPLLQNEGALNSVPGSTSPVTDTPADPCGETGEGGESGTPGGGEGNNDYPAATAPYCRTSVGCPWSMLEAGYAVQCANSVAGGCRGECVDWAAWKTVQKNNAIGRKIVWGNADQWDDMARSHGHTVNKTPEVGALVNWEPGFAGDRSNYNIPYGVPGHIASISKVHPDGSFDIEEYNFGNGMNATTDPKATGTPGRYNQRFGLTPSDVSNIIHINSTAGFS